MSEPLTSNPLDEWRAIGFRQAQEIARLRAALERIAHAIGDSYDRCRMRVIAREALAGAAVETSGPLKMICNRHGAIIETGCPECEAKVLLRERHAMNGDGAR